MSAVQPVTPPGTRPGRGPGRLRRAHLLEVSSFAVVGVVAFAVDAGGFLLLRLAGVPLLPATGLASVVAIAVAYAGNRWWTWRDRRAHRALGESVRYVGVSVAGSAIMAGMPLLSSWAWGLDGVLAENISRNVVGMALATTFRFLGYRYLVFRGPGRRA